MSGHHFLNLDEISLSSRGKIQNGVKLLNSYKVLSFTSETQIFKKFIHCLTFDLRGSPPENKLQDQDIYQLKEAIDKLYRAYKNRECTLIQLEGVWPLLTFCFSKISGLELYLQFEKLIQPEERPRDDSQVKQENIFRPKEYFQRNCWKKDKFFMKSLRVLQNTFIQKKIEENISLCKKMLKILIKDNIELLIQLKQFEDGFDIFKKNIIKLQNERRVIQQNKMMGFLQSSPLFSNLIFSDPGDMNHILESFSKEEYLKNQSYQHQELVSHLPLKQRPKSLLNLDPNIIKEEEEREDFERISKQGEKTYIKSSPTKRRIFLHQEENQLMFKATPPRLPKIHQRCPRHRFIEKMYEEQTKKDIFLRQIKKDRLMLKEKQTKKEVLEKNKRKKLKKMKDLPFYSDAQDNEESKNNAFKRSSRKNQIDNDEQFSAPEYQKMEIEESEQITMKRRNPTKNRPIYLADNSMQAGVEQIPFEDDLNPNNLNRFEQQESLFFMLNQKHDLKNNQLQIDDRISLKRDPSLRYLKFKDQPVEGRSLQPIENIEIRKLILCEKVDITMKFHIFQYIRYLQTLQGKQIKKEVMKVSKQMLNLQNQILEVNILGKLMALAIMAYESGSQANLWQNFLQNYINPMLKHCLIINTFTFISEVFNNFSVSNFNQDLTLLNKIQEMFKLIFQIALKSKLQSKLLITLIYSILAVPSNAFQFFGSTNSYNKSYLNLNNPYQIGTKIMKFKFSNEDSAIAFIVGSYIFEELIISDFIKENQNLKDARQVYHERLIQELQEKKGYFSKDQHYYKLISLMKDFHRVYQPELHQKYFINLSNLVFTSLQRLNQESLRANSNDKQKIQKHTQFISTLCNGHIDYVLSHEQIVNPCTLMNILTIRSKINTFKEIVPHCKLTMILYPRVLTLFWARKQLRNPKTQKLIWKYFEDIQKKQYQDLKVIMFNDSMVAESFYNLLLVIQNNLIISNKDFILNTSTNGIGRFTQNSNNLCSQIQKMIVCVFQELQKNLKGSINFCSNTEDISKNKTQLENSEKIIIKFITNMIYPMISQTSLQFNEQNEVLTHSICHYLFGLQFLLHNNCFLKYFQLNLPFESLTHQRFLYKCKEIISFYFEKIPNFFQNHRIVRFFFTIIFDHFSKESNIQKQLEINILRDVQNKKFLSSISSIFGMHMMSCLQKVDKKDVILFPNFIQNPLFKYFQESTTQISISSAKVEKSIIFLTNIFTQFKEYLLAFNQNREFQSQTNELKTFFLKHFILRLIKEIVISIIVGISVRNRQEYLEIPIEKLINLIKELQFITKNTPNQFPEDVGYLYFFLAIQQTTEQPSLSTILNNLYQLLKEKQREISKIISKLLFQVQGCLKKILMSQQEKSDIIVQLLKMIIFILKWSQPNPEWIKKYLVETQIISKGQSLISKIQISQENIQTLLQLFDHLEISKFDFSRMKNTMNVYVDFLSAENFNTSEENSVKNIKKICIILGNMLKNDSKKYKCIFSLFEKILQKFISPILSWSDSNKLNLSKRLLIFCELMKNSQLQRRCYESIVIGKKQHFKRCISLLSDSQRVYKCFEEMILECMIGENSDFLQIKALISHLMRQQKQKMDQSEYINKLLKKLIQKIQKSGSNLYLSEWCKQQLSLKNHFQEALLNKNDWMDEEDD